jgi:SSS family solute:Na+ symporter
MSKIGGWSGLVEALASEPERLQLLRSANVEPEMAWHAVFLGYPIIGIWYWCTDQTIVQRALGARDERHAQVGALFAGFIKILSLFLFILPGIALYALVQRGDAAPLKDSAQALSYLISNMLPSGVLGIVVAALLAALMGSVAGALNSIATLFCYDIYKECRPQASERQLVRVGRLATVAAMALALIWAPLIEGFGSILEGNTQMMCYLAPCITAVFLWGVLWQNASSQAAFLTLTVGSALGFTVFLLDWYGDYSGWKMSFMVASFYLFLICSIFLWIVSKLAPDQPNSQTGLLTWTRPADALRLSGWHGVLNYKFLSIVLISCVVGVYIFLG